MLRRARGEDAAHIARLYISSQGVDGTAASRAALDPSVVQRWVRSSVLHDEVWVMQEEFGQLSGILVVSGNEVEALDVDPSQRRRGRGARLLGVAKSRRPGGLVARVGAGRTAARTFLEHHGFVEQRGLTDAGTTLRWRTPAATTAGRPFRVVPTASRP